jgi:hypothetical protein
MPFDEAPQQHWGVWCLARGAAEGWLVGYGPPDRLTEAFAKACAARFTSQLSANVSHLVTFTAKRAEIESGS